MKKSLILTLAFLLIQNTNAASKGQNSGNSNNGQQVSSNNGNHGNGNNGNGVGGSAGNQGNGGDNGNGGGDHHNGGNQGGHGNSGNSGNANNGDNGNHGNGNNGNGVGGSAGNQGNGGDNGNGGGDHNGGNQGSNGNNGDNGNHGDGNNGNGNGGSAGNQGNGGDNGNGGGDHNGGDQGGNGNNGDNGNHGDGNNGNGNGGSAGNQGNSGDNGNGGGDHNGGDQGGNGNNGDNGNHGNGNNGNGVGGSAGNQGNGGDNGNGGGDHNGGNQGGNGNSGNSGNANNGDNGNHGDGNNGNGNGGSAGNQGNGGDNGNGGGDHNGGDQGGNGNNGDNGNHGDGNNGNGNGGSDGNQGNGGDNGNGGGDHNGGDQGGDNGGDQGGDNGDDQGGDNGGDQGGDNGEDNGQETQVPTEPAKPSKKDELVMEFAGIKPIVYGNLYSTSSIEAVGQSFIGPTKVEYTDSAGGYVVTVKRKYDIALGAAGTWNFPNAGNYYPALANTSLAVGLTVLHNSSVIYKKSAPTLTDAYALKLKGKLPFKAKDLDSWNNGDSVNYTTEGGVSLSFSAIYNAVPMTVAGIFKGSYEYYIEKLEDNKVYVEITRTDLESALLSTGIYYANASLSKVSKEGQNISYIFDLSDEYTAKVYEDVLKGNFLDAQAMGESYADLRVVKTQTTDFKMKGKEFNIGFKTPFVQLLSWNHSNSLYTGFSDTEVHDNGVKTHRDYGIYTSVTSSNFAELERTSLVSFYGAVAKASVGQESLYNTSGTFVWLYETNNGTYKKYRRALKKVKEFTGLANFLDIEIAKKDEKLNYTKLELSVEYSQKFTEYLMNTDLSFNTLKYELVNEINTGCTQEHRNNDRRVECIERETTKARSALSKIKKYAKNMKSSFNKEDKDFVNNYARIGKAILSSKHIFQKLYTKGQSCGLKLKLLMAGEKFIKIEREHEFPVTSECK